MREEAELVAELVAELEAELVAELVAELEALRAMVVVAKEGLKHLPRLYRSRVANTVGLVDAAFETVRWVVWVDGRAFSKVELLVAENRWVALAMAAKDDGGQADAVKKKVVPMEVAAAAMLVGKLVLVLVVV